jgi:enterochelin esterase-like enzyme
MDKLLRDRAENQGTPLLDGDCATFVWFGECAPDLSGDFTYWDTGAPVSLTEIEAGVWIYKLTLPSDAYIEYVYYEQGTRVSDPLNRKLTSNGMGKYNHYFYMPDGKPTRLMIQRRSALRGQVQKLMLRSGFSLAGGKRSIYLYQPATQDPTPLIVVWDGLDYLRRAKITKMIDYLISERRIRPVALALIDNGGAARGLEYACNEATVRLLVDEILPLAQEELNLVDISENPGGYGVLGASMGGLMALYTGLRLPHIFGRVLSQSGAFAFDEYDTVVFDLVRWGERHLLQVWMDVGVFDMPPLLAANRRMQSLMEAQGYSVTYREYNAGHNYPAWRDDVWRGLERLYPLEQ